MKELQVFTIGFTKKGAKEFFTLLKTSGAKRLVDVRLNNVSQLAGFAKRDDLRYFLQEICGMEYDHVPQLAPTKAILDEYKKGKGDWSVYERMFFSLLRQRGVEKLIEPERIQNGCLLCSEHKPDHCHRRLVLEYLDKEWDGSPRLCVKHLM